jgi:hypothetical protein
MAFSAEKRCAFAAGKTQVFLAHLGDEARGSQGITPYPACAFRVADVQRALGAGDADVHQATLFLELDRVLRFAVRQHALLDADQEDVLELQPLGRVQRRQLDGVGKSASLSSRLISAMVCVRSIRFFRPPRPSWSARPTNS